VCKARQVQLEPLGQKVQLVQQVLLRRLLWDSACNIPVAKGWYDLQNG
jgi:hypothetical protein